MVAEAAVAPSGTLLPGEGSGYAALDGVGWKPQKREAARLLALGLRQKDVCARLGVPLRTLKRWCSDADFQAAIWSSRPPEWHELEVQVFQNICLAFLLQRDVFVGELPADAGRYVEALKLIGRVLDKLLVVQVEPVPAADVEPGWRPR